MEQRIKKFVGKKAFVPVGKNIKMAVIISDIKVVYGHEKALVSPLEGKGQQWMNTENFQLA